MKRIYIVGPLLTLALLLSACGDGPAAPSAVDATPTAVADLAEATPEIADTEGITETDPSAAAEETAIPGSDQTPSMTDTVGITDTQSVTDGAAMTDSETMTDTEGITDTQSATDGATITDSETMTDTGAITGTTSMTDAEAITGTDAMTGTPAASPATGMTDTVDAAAVGDGQSRGVIRASELLGYNVENADNEGLGSINDAIISLEQGCINYLLLSFGGILGLGDNQYLIPWRAVTIDPVEERLLLNIDPSALDAAPTFDAENLPDMTMADWDNDLTGYWDTIDVTAPDTAADTTGASADQPGCDEILPADSGNGIGSSDAITETADAEATPAPSEEELTVQMPMVIRLSELLDYSVNNPEGEELGALEDMMIDWRQDRLAYGILSFGGFMGLGEKWFVIPLSAITVDPVEQRLIFDTDPELLQDAPGFDSDNLPDTADPDWDLGIREYWDSLQ